MSERRRKREIERYSWRTGKKISLLISGPHLSVAQEEKGAGVEGSGLGRLGFWAAGEVISARKKARERKKEEVGLGRNGSWAGNEFGSAWFREMIFDFW